MTVGVLVPTYRRTADLERCLRALEVQSRMPEEVVVTVRTTDDETLDFFKHSTFALPLAIVEVEPPGQVAALNRGVAHFACDVVAITDDDAAPRRDWLERILGHFEADPQIGAVGGRDVVNHSAEAADRRVVGRLQWFGKTVGNHHLGFGQPRTVDFLKGANMTYRRAAISGLTFDMRLRGSGAQVHNDLAFSLGVRARGWKLLYDPEIVVDHYPGERFDEDARHGRSVRAVADAAYNETIVLLEHLEAARRPIFILWSILVGTRDKPGLIQVIRLGIFEKRLWVESFAICRARLVAVHDLTSKNRRS